MRRCGRNQNFFPIMLITQKPNWTLLGHTISKLLQDAHLTKR